MNDKKGDFLYDRSLVQRIVNGDTNSFREVVQNTERLVAQIVFRMIAHEDDRKDIAQDVYLKAFQKLHTFRFQCRLSTWIGQIAYNTCLNHIARKKFVSPLNVEAITDHEFFEENNNDQLIQQSFESSIYNKELTEILKVELNNLTPLYRMLIALYHNEGLSYVDISGITGLPMGTVKNYLFRARKELKDRLLLKYYRDAL